MLYLATSKNVFCFSNWDPKTANIKATTTLIFGLRNLFADCVHRTDVHRTDVHNTSRCASGDTENLLDQFYRTESLFRFTFCITCFYAGTLYATK